MTSDVRLEGTTWFLHPQEGARGGGEQLLTKWIWHVTFAYARELLLLQKQMTIDPLVHPPARCHYCNSLEQIVTPVPSPPAGGPEPKPRPPCLNAPVNPFGQIKTRTMDREEKLMASGYESHHSSPDGARFSCSFHFLPPPSSSP